MTTLQDKMEQADKELFLSWKDHPVTEMLMEWAARQRNNLMEQWADGGLSAAFTTEMLVRNAGATGYCNAMRDLLGIDYVELEGKE